MEHLFMDFPILMTVLVGALFYIYAVVALGRIWYYARKQTVLLEKLVSRPRDRDMPYIPPMSTGFMSAVEYAATTAKSKEEIISEIRDGRLAGRQVNGSWMVQID